MRNWRLLLIDDDREICELIKGSLESINDNDIKLEVNYSTKFDEALDLIESNRIDILILDVRVGDYNDDPDGEEAGRKTLEKVKERIFVPVIFHTGLPNAVTDLQSDLIRVVSKDSTSAAKLLDEIKSLLSTRLPELNRSLIRHVEEVQRKYMWEFVYEHWDAFRVIENMSELAHLLARRLAISLAVDEIKNLELGLGATIVGDIESDSGIHPMSYYIIPPVSAKLRTGEIYRLDCEGSYQYWILLTPSCDLVTRVGQKKTDRKAEYILLAECKLLSDQKEYQELKSHIDIRGSLDSMDLSAWEKKYKDLERPLKKLAQNNPEKRQKDRYFFLPKAWTVPNLIIDFQRTKTIPSNEFFAEDSPWTRLATIDSPFIESLVSQFNRFFGRVGTPDLKVEVALSDICLDPGNQK
jgi:CheY-like chemotaxis protein